MKRDYRMLYCKIIPVSLRKYLLLSMLCVFDTSFAQTNVAIPSAEMLQAMTSIASSNQEIEDIKKELDSVVLGFDEAFDANGYLPGDKRVAGHSAIARALEKLDLRSDELIEAAYLLKMSVNMMSSDIRKAGNRVGMVIGSTAGLAQNAMTISSVCNEMEKQCSTSHTSADSAAKSASYALGVKFQRDVAGNFADLDYSYFLTGIREAKDSVVTLSKADIDQRLKQVILSKSDQSKQFLKNYITRQGVISIQGIYAMKNVPEMEKAGSSIIAGSIKLPECGDDNLVDAAYRVAYVRLTLDEQQLNEWKGNARFSNCIDVNKSQVIRGWRTALSAMKPGDVWDVVIPPELAYGENGLKDDGGGPEAMLVDPDVAVRFLIRLDMVARDFSQNP